MLKHDSLIQEVPAENHEQISRILLEFIERQCVLKEKCHMWRRACGVAVLAQCMASVFIICIGFYYFYRASERSLRPCPEWCGPFCMRSSTASTARR